MILLSIMMENRRNIGVIFIPLRRFVFVEIKVWTLAIVKLMRLVSFFEEVLFDKGIDVKQN